MAMEIIDEFRAYAPNGGWSGFSPRTVVVMRTGKVVDVPIKIEMTADGDFEYQLRWGASWYKEGDGPRTINSSLKSSTVEPLEVNVKGEDASFDVYFTVWSEKAG